LDTTWGGIPVKTAKILVALAAVALAGAVGFVYLGIYNIGADSPHWWPTHKMIGIFRERAVAAHATGIKVPALGDPAMVAEGAEHYSAMCVQCHLAPGMENTELREGLYPLPPNLAEHKHPVESFDDAARDAARQFWIIKHGIKMTGMPAGGKTHDDKAIWNIVAFVRKLPDMNAEEYARLTKNADSHEHGEMDGGEHMDAPGATPHQHDAPAGHEAGEHAHEPQADSPK
jgi:mono/diheme cytochrome c family protein